MQLTGPAFSLSEVRSRSACPQTHPKLLGGGVQVDQAGGYSGSIGGDLRDEPGGPGSSPITLRRLNSHHNPPLMPLRRYGHAAVQLNRPAEQAVGRMALDLLSGPFGVVFRGLIHRKSFRGSVFRQSSRDGRTICWGRLGGVGNHAPIGPEVPMGLVQRERTPELPPAGQPAGRANEKRPHGDAAPHGL